jgi:chromosome segregation ATPase
MNVDYLLEQIELHNSTYEWIVKESQKIAEEIKKYSSKNTFNSNKLNKLTNQFIELENRFKSNRTKYNEVIAQVREYFNDKHGIDIMGILEQ